MSMANKDMLARSLEQLGERLWKIRRGLVDAQAFAQAFPNSPLVMSAAEQALLVAEGQRILALAQPLILAYNASAS